MSQAGVLQKVLSYWIRRELGETEDDPSASISWARSQWGHRLDGLFLQRKDWLIKQVVDCCESINRPCQSHHRFNEEATFEELSQRFGKDLMVSWWFVQIANFNSLLGPRSVVAQLNPVN